MEQLTCVSLTKAEREMLRVLEFEGGGRAGYLGSQRWGIAPIRAGRPASVVLNRLVTKKVAVVEETRYGRMYYPVRDLERCE